MTIWVVADDEDLSAVLQSVAIEAGLDVECMDAEEAGTRLDAGSSPAAMLTTRSAFSPDRSGQLQHIPRLAVASAMPDGEARDAALLPELRERVEGRQPLVDVADRVVDVQ